MTSGSWPEPSSEPLSDPSPASPSAPLGADARSAVPIRIEWAPGLHPLPTAPRGRLRFAAITGLGCGGLLIVGMPFVVVMLVLKLTRGEDLGRDFPMLFTWPIPLAFAALLLWSGIRSVRGLRRASGDPVPLAAGSASCLVDTGFQAAVAAWVD